MVAAVQSIQSNSVPPGGPTAMQPVPPSGVPAGVDALVDALPQAIIQAFRRNSSPLSVPIGGQAHALGDQQQTQLPQVGLGYRIVSKHDVILTIANNSGGSVTISLGQFFPYNLLTNTTVAINGGATVYNASGVAGLMVLLRNKRGSLTPFSAETPFATGVQGCLSNAMCVLTVAGTGVTISGKSGQALTGVSAITITNTNTATLHATFFTVEKLAFNRDTLLGALPLQNSTTYATITRSTRGSGADSLYNTGVSANAFPFYGADCANVTFALTSWADTATYDFWSVPPDPRLYAPIISNSYQVVEQTGLTASATGAAAITYNIPQNNYLTALHMFIRNTNGTLLIPSTDLGQVQIKYSGQTVNPYNLDIASQVAREWLDTGNDFYGYGVPGYVLWDGNATSESLNATDEAGWIDCYNAANPQFIVDIGAGIAVPVTYSVTRESVVPGAVAVIGG